MIHIRGRHTEERPHACPHCPYRSAYRSDLYKHIRARHMRTKQNIKKRTVKEMPHACSYCPFRSTRRDRLVKHIRAEHNKRSYAEIIYDRPYACPYCPHRTKQKYNLRNHIRNQHAAEKLKKHYGCPYCPYRSRHRRGISCHITKKHATKLTASHKPSSDVTDNETQSDPGGNSNGNSWVKLDGSSNSSAMHDEDLNRVARQQLTGGNGAMWVRNPRQRVSAFGLWGSL